LVYFIAFSRKTVLAAAAMKWRSQTGCYALPQFVDLDLSALCTALAETSDHGYPVLEHVKRLVDDKIIWVLTTRGGDFALHLGQDVSIGYFITPTTSCASIFKAPVALTPPAKAKKS
jgi:uncharacterized linocin/CFP29 family protein